MKGSQVQYGDVLLNITGASIGRVFYWNKKSIEANVNQHVCIIRVNDRVIFQYIQGFLAAEIGQLQIFSGQDGTSREGLNFEELKNFVVVLPPLQEQTEIVSFIDQQTQLIDQLISKTKTQIEKLKTYRQTIISEAVTGKIDVSGWAG
jgi:type I restriction enzyme S subunit